MSDNQNKTLFNNIIFIVLIALLLAGACKNGLPDFSGGNFVSPSENSNKMQNINNKPEFEEPSIFDTVQGERVREKINYSTAMEFFNQRQLSGTEILELGKRSSTSQYFVRNSNKKLIFYPTTGTDRDMQSFMRDFTRLRSNLKHRADIVFIPIETGLPMHEKQIKNSSDRVFYNLKKDCGKFCIINVPSRNITSLNSPQIGAKTFEVIEAVINSL